MVKPLVPDSFFHILLFSDCTGATPSIHGRWSEWCSKASRGWWRFWLLVFYLFISCSLRILNNHNYSRVYTNSFRRRVNPRLKADSIRIYFNNTPLSIKRRSSRMLCKRVVESSFLGVWLALNLIGRRWRSL